MEETDVFPLFFLIFSFCVLPATIVLISSLKALSCVSIALLHWEIGFELHRARDISWLPSSVLLEVHDPTQAKCFGLSILLCKTELNNTCLGNRFEFKSNKMIHVQSVSWYRLMPSSLRCHYYWSRELCQALRSLWHLGKRLWNDISWTRGLSSSTLHSLCRWVCLARVCTCWWVCCGFAMCAGVCEESVRQVFTVWE